ncbi:MAG: hypothetical protein II942_01615 [Alphaproteobacteria bacterium]|nr:hypothetical protein [Alphaproteobacteria bacterium]
MKILFCFLLIKAVAVQASDLLPDYPWQEVPFGRVRLISARSTFTPQSPLYLAVQATPNDGWKIGTPSLMATASTHAVGTTLIPFEQRQDNTFYYPVIFTITPTTQPITFSVQGTIPACKEQSCIDTKINLNLTLNAGYGLFTPQYPFISDTLALTPVPMDLNRVKGWAIPNGDSVTITLDLPLAPGKISLYTDNKEPIEAPVKTDGKRVIFQLPTPTDNRVTLLLDATNTIYAIDLPLLSADTKIPTPFKIRWWMLIPIWGLLLLVYFIRRFICKNRA